MKTPAEIQAMDLRRTCFHEAGHLIALQSFGGVGHFRVEKVPGVQSIYTHRAFTGYCEVLIDPVGENREHQHRVIGMAGLAAEYLDEDPDTQPDEIWDAIIDGSRTLSSTDRKHGATYEAIEEAFAVLRSRWSDVVREAEFEIKCWVTAPGESHPSHGGEG